MEKTEQKTIVCSHAKYSGECERLSLWGRNEMKIYPRIEVINGFFGDISPRLTDFIEIATYIYAVDQTVVRCQGIVDPHGLRWNRNIKMIIAVQDYDFWSRKEVVDILQETMNFLSDDRIVFKFEKMENRPPGQSYFHFVGNETDLLGKPEQVMLFSGGLDSLGGAVQEMIVDGRNTVLVRHQSSQKFQKRYDTIEKALKERSGHKGCFISINTGKDSEITKEYTQRGRSFLYFALAATIAKLLGLDNIRFYENGPISLNLPLSGQVVGGRATRTTHPQTLNYFQKLMSMIADGKFSVENPFLYKTKSGIVKLLIEQNCGDLIKQSMSCAHSWQQSNLHHHCGTCSQCIDRRVAIIAAGASQYDSDDDYLVDFFTESVDKKKDDFEAENKNLLTSYFLRGDKIGNPGYNMRKFEADYPELYDAVLYMGGDPYNATKKIYTLYVALAKDIQKVAEYATSGEFLKRARSVHGNLPPDCLCNILLQNTRPKIEYKIIEPKPQENYIFKKNGEVWKIRFAGGKVKMLIDSKDMYALKRLLSSPDEHFSIEELISEKTSSPSATVDMDEIVEGFGSDESYDAAIDGKTRKECLAEVRRLTQELESAQNENNEVEIQEIEEELRPYREYIASNLKPNGKAKNLNTAAKKKKASLERNIRSIKERLERVYPELKAHLDNCLTLGKSPCYHPTEAIHWDTAEE